MNYSTQDEILLTELREFYKKDNSCFIFLEIINGNMNISLQIINWFVTNYSKQNFIKFPLVSSNGETRIFNVYLDYKLKLKGYNKKRFDAFCRDKRIVVTIGNNGIIETTIGQLHFFKWLIENNIIQYIKEHYKEIEDDMIVRNKKKDSTQKRKELSISACKCIHKENVEIRVSFK